MSSADNDLIATLIDAVREEERLRRPGTVALRDEDNLMQLPGLGRKKLDQIRALGIGSIADLEDAWEDGTLVEGKVLGPGTWKTIQEYLVKHPGLRPSPASEARVQAEEALRASAVTTAEELLLNMLASVWNTFLELPTEHPMEREEFCSAIHRCQDIIGAQSAWRQLRAKEAS